MFFNSLQILHFYKFNILDKVSFSVTLRRQLGRKPNNEKINFEKDKTQLILHYVKRMASRLLIGQRHVRHDQLKLEKGGLS